MQLHVHAVGALLNLSPLRMTRVINLACISSETHKLQPVFLCIYDTKGGSLCQAFQAETVETGNNNCCVTEVIHVLRRKLRKD